MKRVLALLAVAVVALAATSARAEPIGAPMTSDSWDQWFQFDSWDVGAVQIQYWILGDNFKTPTDGEALSQFQQNGAGWSQAWNNGTYAVATGPALTGYGGYDYLMGFAGNYIPFTLHYQSYDEDGNQLANVDLWYNNGWGWTTNGTWDQEDPLPLAGPVPEPFSMAFLGSVFVGVVALRLRGRRKEGK